MTVTELHTKLTELIESDRGHFTLDLVTHKNQDVALTDIRVWENAKVVDLASKDADRELFS